LAQYQILKPGDKPVCKHPSRKAGFDQAQKELEAIIQERQAQKKKQRTDEPFPFLPPKQPMKDVINSQVGQSLTNCTNMIQQQAPGKRKDLLETLAKDVRTLIESLPEDKKKDASKVADKLKKITEEAIKEEPEREWYSLSAKGLLEAATWVKDFSGKIGGTILELGKSIWSDFKMPG